MRAPFGMVVKCQLLSVDSAFQEHTEQMRKKLANQKQQQVDDEDDRIAKAVAERERKREVRHSLPPLTGLSNYQRNQLTSFYRLSSVSQGGLGLRGI